MNGSSNYSEVEGVCVLAKLFEQALLQAAEWFVLLRQWRKSLEGGDVKVLSEGQSQHVKILSAITKRTGQSHKHCPGSEERRTKLKKIYTRCKFLYGHERYLGKWMSEPF